MILVARSPGTGWHQGRDRAPLGDPAGSRPPPQWVPTAMRSRQPELNQRASRSSLSSCGPAGCTTTETGRTNSVGSAISVSATEFATTGYRHTPRGRSAIAWGTSAKRPNPDHRHHLPGRGRHRYAWRMVNCQPQATGHSVGTQGSQVLAEPPRHLVPRTPALGSSRGDLRHTKDEASRVTPFRGPLGRNLRAGDVTGDLTGSRTLARSVPPAQCARNLSQEPG